MFSCGRLGRGIDGRFKWQPFAEGHKSDRGPFDTLVAAHGPLVVRVTILPTFI